jgi:hypothetical protein
MPLGLASLLMLQIASRVPEPLAFNTLLSGNPPRPAEEERYCLEQKRTHVTYCLTIEEWRAYAKKLDPKQAPQTKP